MTMLAKVDLEKCERLAAFLETVPPGDFDLTYWRSVEPVSAIKLGPIVLRHGCGFAGCAIGWAAYSGIFPGLRLEKKGKTGARPVYAGFTEFRAAAALLGVNESQAVYFFDPDSYSDKAEPGDVADRIRVFVTKVRRRLMRRNPVLRAVA